ncbi:MAG TPA: hypothetical protein VHA77_19220 [Xanthobacteraceae bacterium]|nr:hypothetical protein [Xanthobacteraceae bacterium]
MGPASSSPDDTLGAYCVSLLAYVSGLVGLAGLAVMGAWHLSIPDPVVPETRPASGWVTVDRPRAAFDLALPHLGEPVYSVLRHPAGGRKDVIRFGVPGETPIFAAIELYRPGAELDRFGDPLRAATAGAGLLGPAMRASIAPVIESKFGPVAAAEFLVEQSGRRWPCLGFARTFEAPRLRISGVYCERGAPNMARTVLACALDRLTLVSAGADATLSSLFARAELKRTSCALEDAPALRHPGDWIDAMTPPRLRGRLAELD